MASLLLIRSSSSGISGKGAAAMAEATQEKGGRERVNCVRDAKSDQMKNEQQTAVIDDQNGEEERRTAKGSRKARRAGGTGNKAGIGRATVRFNGDLGLQGNIFKKMN